MTIKLKDSNTCYQGAVVGTIHEIAPGQTSPAMPMMRSQWHGCNGEGGIICTAFDPPVGANKDRCLSFTNDGQLFEYAEPGHPNPYPGKLQPKDRASNSYTYLTWAHPSVQPSSRPVALGEGLPADLQPADDPHRFGRGGKVEGRDRGRQEVDEPLRHGRHHATPDGWTLRRSDVDQRHGTIDRADDERVHQPGRNLCRHQQLHVYARANAAAEHFRDLALCRQYQADQRQDDHHFHQRVYLHVRREPTNVSAWQFAREGHLHRVAREANDQPASPVEKQATGAVRPVAPVAVAPQVEPTAVDPAKGYVLRYDGKIVSGPKAATLTLQQAQDNCASSRQRYPNITVGCTFNGNAL